MKKIAAITFHRAENFGSVLQTYALKETVLKISEQAHQDTKYQVIDISSDSQKELYRIFKKSRRINDIIKNIVNLIYLNKLKTRKNKFNTFLNTHLPLSEHFSEKDNIEEKIGANFYISGSDQIWNVRTKDFSDFYYLDFVKKAKKVSYAASFGPLNIDWEKYNVNKYSQLLHDFSAISVREEGSRKNIKLLTGKDCDIHIDPTLLLNKSEWQKIQSNANYNGGKYILLYCLEPSKLQLKMAKEISKKLNLPIVTLRYNNKNDIFNSFVKKYDAGPKDFLSFIDNAALVLTSSFHGTAFSLIYQKPFYILDNSSDNRISSILKITDKLDRCIDLLDDLDKVSLDSIDFSKSLLAIEDEKQRSINYLKTNLEIQ